MSNIKVEEIKELHDVEADNKILFEELKESDMKVIDDIHTLYPQWGRLSVIKKLKATIEGNNLRFIAKKNGKIIAHVKIVPGTGIHEHIAEITSLIVFSKERRQGIGVGLMQYSISKLPKKIILLKLAVNQKNKPAINLYKKMGFEKYGLLKKASKISGNFIDNYLMSKEINK